MGERWQGGVLEGVASFWASKGCIIDSLFVFFCEMAQSGLTTRGDKGEAQGNSLLHSQVLETGGLTSPVGALKAPGSSGGRREE